MEQWLEVKLDPDRDEPKWPMWIIFCTWIVGFALTQMEFGMKADGIIWLIMIVSIPFWILVSNRITGNKPKVLKNISDQDVAESLQNLADDISELRDKYHPESIPAEAYRALKLAEIQVHEILERRMA